MSEVIVDASAVLALLNQENGSEEVSQFISNAAISTVYIVRSHDRQLKN